MIVWLLALVLASFPASAADFQPHEIELHVLDQRGDLQTFADRYWDPIFDQAPGVIFGARLLGPRPYTRNSDRTFRPASTSKLFTTLAMLDRFGADYQIETQVRWIPLAGEPGSIRRLTLLGSGDPSWGMEEFGETYGTRIEQIALMLRNRGITRVVGTIAVKAADPRLASPRMPDGWAHEDRDACYGVLGQAFNLQINCATYIVTGPKNGHFEEAQVPLLVRHRIRIGRKTKLAAYRGTDGFTVAGTFSPGSPPVVLYLPIDNATEWVRRLFLQALLEQGITVEESHGKFQGEFQDPSDSGTESFSLYSPKLSEMLKPFLKLSLNSLGDSFFRILGASARPSEPDLIVAGQSALSEFVSKLGTSSALAGGYEPQEGYFADEVTLRDGAGLSRQSRVTTGALTTLLQDATHRGDFAVVWQALPIAGVDGTLKGRMKGTAAEGILRAKTGSLYDTYNLSGYVPRVESDGTISQWVPFVLLSHLTESGTRSQARAVEDDVGARLAARINSNELR